jgi:ABC-type sugar transport system ATPase subunit
VSRGRERALAEGAIRDLQIRTPRADTPIASLSGGNQQKAVIARWLVRRPDVLILDEPTKGVDVGAKAEIHRLVGQLAADGVAVLMISSDLEELLALSDRVLVMRTGRLVVELDRPDASRKEVMSHAAVG